MRRAVPAYVDFEGAIYGTRDIDGLGVKAAPDFDGPPLDPDASCRPPPPESERLARAFLAERFPALADAPLAGIQDVPLRALPRRPLRRRPLPGRPSVWLLGGGSGHGFKHGPAIAELVAAALDGGEPMPARFALGERGSLGLLRTGGAARPS